MIDVDAFNLLHTDGDLGVLAATFDHKLKRKCMTSPSCTS
jgi:hypothetical protein